MHRFVGLLIGAFVWLHVLFVALDTYVHFSLVQLLVPGASSYLPLWVALGIVAAELLVAIAVTNVFRRRLGHTRWRRAHYFRSPPGRARPRTGSAPAPTRAPPGSGSSTCSRSPPCSDRSAGASAARGSRPARRGAAVAAALVFSFALVLGLGKLPAGIASPRVARATASPLPGRVVDSFGGSVLQEQGAGGALVSVIGNESGERRLLGRIDLVTPDGRKITDTALQVRDLASGEVCSGTVSRIGGAGFEGTCRFPGGASRAVSGEWRVSGGAVSGHLRLGRAE